MWKSILPTGLVQIGDEEVLQKWGGAKRERYRRAQIALAEEGLRPRDWRLNTFIKLEGYAIHNWPHLESPGFAFDDVTPKIASDPRSINARGDKFGAALARFTHPMEHRVYTVRGKGRYFPAGRFIVKGLNNGQRAQLFVRKWKQFSQPVGIRIDCKRFDQHVSVEQLICEHAIYLHMNPSRELRRLLQKQLMNRGVAACGWLFKVLGVRMSGDHTTALGNCLLMCMMVALWIFAMRIRKWDLVDDGDDAIIIMESNDWERVQGTLLSFFLEMGHELDIEGVARSLEEIVFCQSRLVQLEQDRWVFVRNPSKVMSQTCAGTKWMDTETGRKRYLRSVGLGELMMNAGVPVLQSYALALLRASEGAKVIDYRTESGLYRYQMELSTRTRTTVDNISSRPITDMARRSFAACYGVPMEEQLRMEAHLDRLVIPTGETVEALFDDEMWSYPTELACHQQLGRQ